MKRATDDNTAWNMDRSSYLAHQKHKNFIEYLSRLLSGNENLNICFKVPKKNKEYPIDYWETNPRRTVRYYSMRDALSQYYWGRNDFCSNEAALVKVSKN